VHTDIDEISRQTLHDNAEAVAAAGAQRGSLLAGGSVRALYAAAPFPTLYAAAPADAPRAAAAPGLAALARPFAAAAPGLAALAQPVSFQAQPAGGLGGAAAGVLGGLVNAVTGATGAAAAAGANAAQSTGPTSGVGSGLGDMGSGVSPNAIQLKAPNPNIQVGPDDRVPSLASQGGAAAVAAATGLLVPHSGAVLAAGNGTVATSAPDATSTPAPSTSPARTSPPASAAPAIVPGVGTTADTRTVSASNAFASPAAAAPPASSNLLASLLGGATARQAPPTPEQVAAGAALGADLARASPAQAGNIPVSDNAIRFNLPQARRLISFLVWNEHQVPLWQCIASGSPAGAPSRPLHASTTRPAALKCVSSRARIHGSCCSGRQATTLIAAARIR